jgi:uncharacterized phiE125 gp8 family phage protein
MITPNVITGPIAEPVTVAEAEAQLRIPAGTDTANLTRYIKAARSYWEARTGRTAHEQTLEMVLSEWPACGGIVLPRATPLIEIVSVIYADGSGTPTTWADTDYIEDTYETPGRLVLAYGASWPSFVPYPVSPIRIRYRAGLATGSPPVEVDADIKQAVLLLVGVMYENREAVQVSDSSMISQLVIKYGLEDLISKQQVDYAF